MINFVNIHVPMIGIGLSLCSALQENDARFPT